MHRIRILSLGPVCAIFVAVFVLSACDEMSTGPVYHPDGYKVRYEVVNTCTSSVTLQAATGVSQYTIGPSSSDDPWWYMRGAQSRDFLYVSAQLRCRNGVITTRILKWDARARYVDPPGWYVWRQNTSQGDFVISTTSGSY